MGAGKTTIVNTILRILGAKDVRLALAEDHVKVSPVRAPSPRHAA